MTAITLNTGMFANDSEMNEMYAQVIKGAAKKYNEYISTKDENILAAYTELVNKIAKSFDIDDCVKILVDVVAAA